MDIKTVVMGEPDEDGKQVFVVNDLTFVPDDMRNRHRVMIQEWLDAGNVAADWVDPMTPYQKWHNKIHLSDRDMPRIYEDMIDRDGTDDLPQAVIDKYNAKKALRSTKPKE